MKLEYEKIDNKYIRFKNNQFKLNVTFLPILGLFSILIALIICLVIVFASNVLFIICGLIGAYGVGNLGFNCFRIYKEIKNIKQ